MNKAIKEESILNTTTTMEYLKLALGNILLIPNGAKLEMIAFMHMGSLVLIANFKIFPI
jgi:hypothetical protein